MGTIVTIEIVGVPAGDDAARDGIDRAMGWFREVERICNRFDPDSELRQLSARHGIAVPVSALLFSAVEFATEVARETGGAFDPAIGARIENMGIDRDYRTGVATPSGVRTAGTFRDIALDPARSTICLAKPLLLDLGAVAKGLAIDLAARELAPFRDFAIDAGGDLFLAGHNTAGRPWSAGIRHPSQDREVIEAIRVSDMAVCSSGNYERLHVIDARDGTLASQIASATVIAPTAMLADALATAAFILGTDDGIALLERHGVQGVLWTADLRRHATGGYDALLSHA